MEGMQPKYSMACAPSPTRTGEGGAMPQAHYPYWASLVEALRSIECGEEELAKAKKSLDQFGSYTLQDVWLDETALRKLGFVEPMVRERG
jgi:hypothetical protein